MESSGFVETDSGVELYYRRFGDGPMKVLVPGRMYLLPGLSSLARPDREFIFFDQRGRGRSTTITDEEDLGVGHEVSDLETIRRQLGLERVTLIGWSYLGIIVSTYALKYPDRVDRIVLLGPLYPRRTPYARMHQDTIAERRSPDDVQRYNALVAKMQQGRDSRATREEAQTLISRPQFADPAFEATLTDDFYSLDNERSDRVFGFQIPGVLKTLGNWDLREQLSSLPVPTLVIHGAHDPLPIESAEEWVQSLPNSRLLVAHNSGHYPWDEEPEPVLGAIDTFLSNVRQPSNSQLSPRNSSHEDV